MDRLQREITSLRLSPSTVHILKSPYVCVYCIVLQCAATRHHAAAVTFRGTHSQKFVYVCVCCSALQCAAARDHVAAALAFNGTHSQKSLCVCVLQCVAVCCNARSRRCDCRFQRFTSLKFHVCTYVYIEAGFKISPKVSPLLNLLHITTYELTFENF